MMKWRHYSSRIEHLYSGISNISQTSTQYRRFSWQ